GQQLGVVGREQGVGELLLCPLLEAAALLDEPTSGHASARGAELQEPVEATAGHPGGWTHEARLAASVGVVNPGPLARPTEGDCGGWKAEGAEAEGAEGGARSSRFGAEAPTRWRLRGGGGIRGRARGSRDPS